MSADSRIKILTVCKMNQARSPFAQSVLTQHFPNLRFASAGVEARSGSTFVPEVVGIARRWGITLARGFSQRLSEMENLSDFNLVVCAEEWMLREVASLGYSGTLISYEDVVADPSFMPRDPVGLAQRKMEAELAKVALINVTAVRNFLNIKTPSQIFAAIPETESAVDLAIDWAQAKSADTGGILIDADLRAPLLRDLKKRGLNVGSFSQIGQLDVFDAFSGMVEHPNPENFLIGSGWTEIMNNLAISRPIVMVTAPQHVGSGPLADPYLAAIPATEIRVIRK